MPARAAVPPAEQEVRMSTIVVGYVPKPEGRAAVTAAVGEAQRRGCRVIVVNSHRESREGRRTEGDRRARAELEDAGSELQEAGVDFEVHQVVRGNDPVDDLLTVASEHQAELVVIGLRRRTPVGKLILGSNAQQILLSSPCPVLAVKA